MQPTLFTKTFVNKVVLQSCWHVTLAMVWARKPKVFTPKKSFFKAMSEGKCRARALVSILSFSLLLDLWKHFIRHSLLLDRFTFTLFIDQGLQRQHMSFLFVWRWGKQTLMTFLLERVLRLSEHYLPLFVRDNYSKLDPFYPKRDFQSKPELLSCKS